MREKIQKKRKIFDFFLFCIFTHKKFSLEKRVLFLYIHIRERGEKQEQEQEQLLLLFSSSSEISFLSSNVSFLCALLTREFPFFFYSVKLRKTFRTTMREEEEEEERTMHATTTNTAHELRVIVRDARGMREEAPLRVHAKFDDEEKMTVSNRVYISLFLLFVCTLERENVLTKEWS